MAHSFDSHLSASPMCQTVVSPQRDPSAYSPWVTLLDYPKLERCYLTKAGPLVKLVKKVSVQTSSNALLRSRLSILQVRGLFQ